MHSLIRPAVAGLFCLLAMPVANAFEPDARVFPAGQTATIRLTPSNDREKAALDKLTCQYIREDGRFQDGKSRHGNNSWETLKHTVENGAVVLTIPLRGEYEHALRFSVTGENGKLKKLSDVNLISLDPDLFRLRPWKGDWHMHSKESDGKFAPARVAAYGRRAGYDFMALTDHRKYAPSVEARKAAESWKCGMTVLSGEEFHTEDGVLHSLSIGASSGINSWSRANAAEFDKLAEAELKTDAIATSEMDEFDQLNAARAGVLYRHARETGALIIYCHPYWKPNQRYNAPTRFNEYMLEKADFDAVEMPNGGSMSYMQLTAAKRFDLAGKGRLLPVVGVSDTHDASGPSLGEYSTVVFAESPDLESLRDAVRNHRSVAAYLRFADQPIYNGSYRFVKLAYFLHDNYMKRHNELCRKQGELLLKLTDGDESVRPEIERLTAEIDGLRDSTWSK